MLALENKNVKGLFFKQTCVVAPEQYDVFLNGKYVAYVRCRWGKLKVNPIDTDKIIIPDIEHISDYDFEFLENNFHMYGHTDFEMYIYYKEWPDEPYKSDIPKEEFEKIADAIYRYLNRETK